MGSHAFTDVTTYIAGYDITTDSNELSLTAMAEELDATTFGSGGYRTRKGGLKDLEVGLNGFWDASSATASVDPLTFASLGTSDQVLTIAQDDAESSIAYMGQVNKFGYQMFGAIGPLTPFSLDMKGSNAQGLVRGQLAKLKGNVSATGQLGSILNLGAPVTGQFVYCAVHIFSAGTTITLQLQSDDAVGFTTPTTRATIGPITTTGGTWMTRVAGPFALETHWRLNISAITGTFSIAAAIAVQ